MSLEPRPDPNQPSPHPGPISGRDQHANSAGRGSHDYLDDPVLEPRMALAPHMQRPEAPVDPVPAGYNQPGSSYPPTGERRRRKGSARKMDVSEELLEEQSARLSHGSGTHWQKGRGLRDIFIVSLALLAVAAIIVILLIPEKYIGVKEAPVDQPTATSTGTGSPANTESAEAISERGNGEDLDAERRALRSDRDLTQAEKDAIVAQAMKEAMELREDMDAELETMLKTTDPNAPLPADALAPPNPSAAPAPRTSEAPAAGDSSAAETPAPTPAPRPRPKPKTQAEIEDEVNRQMQEKMDQMIREGAIEPVPAPPPPAVTVRPAPGSAPAAPPRAVPANP